MADNEFEDLDIGDEGGEGAPAEAEGGGLKRFFSGSLVRILLYVAAAVLVVIIAVVAGSIAGKRSSESEGYRADREKLKEKQAPLMVFDVKEFMANTSDIDTPHMMKVKLQLAFDKKNQKLQVELNERRIQIRDIVLLYFKARKKEELETATQVEALKKDLKDEINKLLQDGEIETIYFEEFSIN